MIFKDEILLRKGDNGHKISEIKKGENAINKQDWTVGELFDGRK